MVANIAVLFSDGSPMVEFGTRGGSPASTIPTRVYGNYGRSNHRK